MRNPTLTALAAVLILEACGTTSPSPVVRNENPPAVPTVTSVSISGVSSMIAGQTSQLAATANLSNGTQQVCTASATWQTSNPDVVLVTISNGATVRAIRSGTAEIKATCQGITGSLQVSVTAACTYLLRSASTVTFGAGGGTGQITVTPSSPTCEWSVEGGMSAEDWIHVASTHIVGPGSVTFTVRSAAETTFLPLPRTGKLYVVDAATEDSPLIVEVTQSSTPSTSNVSGRWTGTSTYPNAPFTLDLTQNGNSLSGTYRDRSGGPDPVSGTYSRSGFTLRVDFGDAVLFLECQIENAARIRGSMRTSALGNTRYSFVMTR